MISGTVIVLRAHGTELLLVHQSILSYSSESVARIAFALKNDFTVSTLAPPRLNDPSPNVPFIFARVVSGGRTLFTICVTMVPSFFRSFCGRLVQHRTLVSIAKIFVDRSFPRGMISASLSG